MTNTIRIPEGVYEDLQRALPLDVEGNVETIALGIGRVCTVADRRVYVLDEVLQIEDYELREPARVRADDRRLLGLTARLRGRGTFALLAHTHPRGPGRYSLADDDHEKEVARVVAGAADGAQLLSMLRHPGGWTARAWVSGEPETVKACWVVGRPLRQLLSAEAPASDTWARQALALGTNAVVDLRQLRVGVVGVGGLGDPTAAGLARLGVGQIVLVDPDRVELTNVSRLLCVDTADVGQFKVEVVAARLRRAIPSCSVTPLAVGVEDQRAAAELEACDVVVLSTDNHTSRLVGWQIAKRALALTLLAGTDPQAGARGIVDRVSAYVADLQPTDPCPVCQKILDPEHLRQEAMPAEALVGERRDGYIPAVAHPAVLPWNLAAVAEVLGRLLELVAALPPAPARGQIRRLELLALADVRCRTRAIFAKDEACGCGAVTRSELRPRLGGR